MKAIIFVGCNKFGTSYEALITAKKMGYCTILLTDKKSHDFPEADNIIYMQDLHELKTCIDVIKKLQEEGFDICACLSLIDPFVSHAANLAQHFNINEISHDSLYIMENKIRLRDTLKTLGSSPFHTTFHNDTPMDPFINKNKAILPLIIKPPTTNGSKDVFLVDSEEKLRSALHFVQKKHPNHPVLVEQYLLGPQYLIEIIVIKKKLFIIGIIAQDFSDDSGFIITGYQSPAMLTEEETASLTIVIQEIIEKLGISTVSCHLEMRLVNGEWKLVEINPRMSGGAMNKIIEEGTGINLIKEIINLHLGKAPSLLKTKNQHVYAKYLTISRRGKLLKVIGKDKALKHDGIKYVYVKPIEGKILTTPSTMGHRYACVVAASHTAEEAKSIALAAAKEIKFYIEPF